MTAPSDPAPDQSPSSPAEAGGRATMRAVVQEEYGTDPAAVLRIDRVPEPRPGDDDVLVRVHASSIDRGTWHVMAGLPRVARIALGVRRPKMLNPALAFAGTIEQVGAKVTGLRLGDEVYGSGGGAFAEFVVAKRPVSPDGQGPSRWRPQRRRRSRDRLRCKRFATAR